MLKTVEWTGETVRLVDQTLLPGQTQYLEIVDERGMWDAIRRLVVRGAPAIGVAAAFGAYLGVRHFEADELPLFDAKLAEVCKYLASSRPTAVNLGWALQRITAVSAQTRLQGSRTDEQMIQKIKARLLAEALTMLDEDARVCAAIGEHGVNLLRETAQHRGVGGGLHSPLGILTHCNAGALATCGIGTATAPIYLAHQRGLALRVFADETRPLLQGSRLTAFELNAAGVPVTVICDNMAAALMASGRVHLAIVGADRVAANGDVANKIGTLGVAVMARHFGIPFYVAAPLSTIDLATQTGGQIPIEMRDAAEVTHGMGRQSAPDGVDVWNPAFDVTPAALVDGIITEAGVARTPFGQSLRTASGA